MTPGWAALPERFEATFLHSGRAIGHVVSDRELVWFDPAEPDERFAHECTTVELAPRLWLLDFRKEVEGLRRRTFLVVDGERLRALDATFLEEGRDHWRFDRATLDGPLRMDTAVAFPRHDISGCPVGPHARGFALTDDLTLIVDEEDGGPVLSVWETTESARRPRYVAPRGL